MIVIIDNPIDQLDYALLGVQIYVANQLAVRTVAHVAQYIFCKRRLEQVTCVPRCDLLFPKAKRSAGLEIR